MSEAMIPVAKKADLMRSVEAHWDIEHELFDIRRIAQWVVVNFFDRDTIPLIADGEHIDLRRTLLDGLLIRYRRCFSADCRGGLDMARGRTAIGEWLPIHDDELIFRANKIVAHAVNASSSTQIYIGDDQNVSCFIQRPGVNQFDFSNIVRLAEEWLCYVGSERGRLIEELRPLLSDRDYTAPHFEIAPLTAKLDINAARAKRKKRLMSAS